MTLKTGIAALRKEITALEQAASRRSLTPMVVRIVNDPERRSPGPDESTIAGVRHLRADGEGEDEFHARLIEAAAKAGETRIIVSVASYGHGPYLNDLADTGDDPLATIEVTGD
jgi:hypothetical protein